MVGIWSGGERGNKNARQRDRRARKRERRPLCTRPRALILQFPFLFKRLLACGHKRISGRRFSAPELGEFVQAGMLLIVYTKIYVT